MSFRRASIVALAVACLSLVALPSAVWIVDAPPPKTDLADAAEGSYLGCDLGLAKSSSQSGVTLTVKRVGADLVQINADYPRLPVVQVPLTLAMGKILQACGDRVFLLDRAKSPARLNVTINGDFSWSDQRLLPGQTRKHNGIRTS